MKKRINLVGVVTACVLLLAGPTVNAEIITYELPPAFEREYNYNDPYLQMDFDLGVTFTEISNVYIDWSGEITAGLAIFYSNPDEPFPLDVGIYASLGFNPSLRRTEIWKGAESYPDAELYDELSEIKSTTGATNWSDLLDGQGTITVGYTEYIIIDGHYTESGLVTLDNATLTVNGILVPEPATILLLGFGGLILRAC